MKERVQEIPAKVVEFWNRYTSRQKTIIIAVICVVLVLRILSRVRHGQGFSSLVIWMMPPVW